MRTYLARCAFAIAGLVGASSAALAHYPDQPIHFVVPYAAGGGVDNITRVVASALGNQLKQPVIIENRPGANANIGADYVVRSGPDGYTLLMGATFLAFNRATMKNLPYDAGKDLLPVARVGEAPQVLVVPASVPIKNVAELVAAMKAHPDKASYGVVGVGAPAQLLFTKATGTDPVQVLYKGGSAALPDLMAQRLTFMIQTASEVLPLIKGGKLRALAVTSGKRFSHLPDVPTLQEAGVPGIDITGWWGVFVPAGTPAPIVQHLSDALQVATKQPDVVAALNRMGNEPAPMPAPAFSRFFQRELKAYDDLAHEFKLAAQ